MPAYVMRLFCRTCAMLTGHAYGQGAWRCIACEHREQWSDRFADFAKATIGPDHHDLARMADDGCPHHGEHA